MFKNTIAFSSFSVDNLAIAKKFYGKTLGLKLVTIREGLEIHLAGGARVFIYPSTDYNPPEHTILNFLVSDIEKTIRELAKRGVKMEQYDMPGIKTDKKGIVRDKMGPKAIAWFKDPADHILAIIQEK